MSFAGLRVGVVGGGFMGRVHVQAARSAGAQVVAVASTNAESAQRASESLNIPRWYPSVEELMDDSAIDVVHVCSPNATHATIASLAIERGKHVVCEKPLGVTVDEAVSLASLAEKNAVVATVPFVYRFHPLIREARQRVSEGTVGRILSARGTYLQDWLMNPDDTNWRVHSSEGGSSRAFADIGSHLVDLLEFVLSDRLASLTALTNTAHPMRANTPVTTEDEAALIFKTLNGVVGTLMVSQVSPGRKNRLLLDIAGTSESIEFNQEQPETLWVGKARGSELVPRDPSQNMSQANQYSTVPAGHPMGYVDAFAAFVRDTYRVISLGGYSALGSVDGLPTFVDGVRSAQVVEAVLASAQSGDWVSLPGGSNS